MEDDDVISDYSTKLIKEFHYLNQNVMNNISYNVFFTKSFINSNFKNLYVIIKNLDDGILILDKKYKHFSFEEIVKIVYDFKTNILFPLLGKIK